MLTEQSFLSSIHALPLPEAFDSTAPYAPSRPGNDLNEREQLDNLLMRALTDQQVMDRLLVHADPSLLESQGFSDSTRDLVTRCKGRTLVDLARGILTAPSR